MGTAQPTQPMQTPQDSLKLYTLEWQLIADAGIEIVGINAAMVRQTGSSRRCSAMRNFSFLLGDIDGNGLIRSVEFAGDTSIVK